MDEKTALEELQYIHKIIEDTKRTVIYNGMDYIFWGVIVIIGLMGTYTLSVLHIYFNYIWIWVGLCAIGWIFSLYKSRTYHEKLPHTFAGKIIGIVWAATGVSMTILAFVGLWTRAVNPVFISPVLSVILGSAYLITGTVMETKWLSLMSLGWWVGAIIMFFFPGNHSLFIMALMMLCFQTIPGIILFRKYKKETILQSNE